MLIFDKVADKTKLAPFYGPPWFLQNYQSGLVTLMLRRMQCNT